MGDNVMGSFRTNRPPRGRRLGRGRGFRTFRLVRRWFRHESGGIERIAWRLTGSVCSFIVRSIPEGLMFREFSSIWEIQAGTSRDSVGERVSAGKSTPYRLLIFFCPGPPPQKGPGGHHVKQRWWFRRPASTSLPPRSMVGSSAGAYQPFSPLDYVRST